MPERSLKLQAVYNVSALPGLALLAFASHEGRRMVLPDNSIATPGWTRVDLGLRQAQRRGGANLVWRLGVDNVFDRARLEGSAVPVRPRLPVPAGPTHLACVPEHFAVTPVTKAKNLRLYSWAHSPIAQLVERRTVNP